MNEEYKANLSEVYVDKQNLIKVLTENRAKCQQIYDVAVSGYWLKAKADIKQFYQEVISGFGAKQNDFVNYHAKLENRASEQKTPFSSMDFNLCIPYSTFPTLPFPVSYTKEYDKVIRLLELSVHDKFLLTTQQFDQYVMNDWSWKNSFKMSTQPYVQALTGFLGVNALCSGVAMNYEKF